MSALPMVQTPAPAKIYAAQAESTRLRDENRMLRLQLAETEREVKQLKERLRKILSVAQGVV